MAELVLSIEGVYVFLLVLARFAAMLLLNPIFSMTGVPNMARMGLVLFLSLMVAPWQEPIPVDSLNGAMFVLMLVRELFVGIIYSFVFLLFYYMLSFAGSRMDMDMGFSNAQMFDPATNIQSSLSGRLVNVVFILFIFSSGSHLVLFRVFVTSFDFIPLGTARLDVPVYTFILKLLVDVFNLAIRLYAPFLVAEFGLQVAMGLLMRLNPQITIFVINFQLRIILGFLLLFWFSPYIGNFLDQYIDILMRALDAATVTMGSA